MWKQHLVMGVILAIAVIALGAVVPTSTQAAPPPAKTFIAVLTADEEVPPCAAATNADRGVFIGHVIDEETGTVAWLLIASDLPGTISAAHIHIAPEGVAGPVVQPLPPIPGQERGLIGIGTFSNPALLAALRADPDGYYVNVHTDVCGPGVIRGQLGGHGPAH